MQDHAVKENRSLDAWHCPACWSTRVISVSDGAGTNFLCEDCARCWHETMGWVALVDPRSCVDCSLKPRCLEALAARGRSA